MMGELVRRTWADPGRLARLLAATVVLALLCAEERSQLVAPVALALVAAWATPLGRLPRRVWDALSVLALIGFLAETTVFGTPTLLAAVHMLLYLLVNKLHHLERPGDYDHLLLISLLAILALAVLAVQVAVVPFVALYVVLSLRLLELGHGMRTGPPWAGDLAQGSIVVKPRAAAAIGVVALVTFVAFPRVGSGLVQSSLVRPQHVSGFSSEVDLGDIARIKENDAPVARVHPRHRDHQGPRLLRAVAFRWFDGRRWKRDDSALRLLRRSAESRSFPVDRPGPDDRWFGLTLEPLTPSFLPVPLRATTVAGPLPQLVSDQAGSLRLPRWSRRSSGRLTYEVAADLGPSSAIDVAAGGDPADYLELPNLDPRIEPLVSQLRSTSAEATAAAIAELLSGDFSYSLELDERGGDPLAGFLFERRTGHCELFATAMAVLLRVNGIPARVVNGFRVSEWSELGEYFIVRQSDAHAWVEAYFPEQGWVTFDPTPPDPERSRWALGLKGFSHVSDYLLYQWDRYVISFGGADQRLALEQLADFLRGLDPGWVGFGLGLAAIAAAGIVAAARRKRGLPVEVELYLELRRRLVRAGMAVSSATGPDSLRRQFPAVSAVHLVVAAYVDARFRGRPGRRAQILAARRALKGLAAELRSVEPGAPSPSARA